MFINVSVCVFFFFHFGFEGGMWDLIVLVPDHCLSFYFAAFWGIEKYAGEGVLKFRVVFTFDTERAVCPKCAAQSPLPYEGCYLFNQLLQLFVTSGSEVIKLFLRSSQTSRYIRIHVQYVLKDCFAHDISGFFGSYLVAAVV